MHTLENVFGKKSGAGSQLEDARRRKTRFFDRRYEEIEDGRPPRALARSSVSPRGSLRLVVKVFAIEHVVFVRHVRFSVGHGEAAACLRTLSVCASFPRRMRPSP